MRGLNRGAVATVLALGLVFSASLALGAQTRADGEQFERVLGVGLPSIGRVHYGEDGLINRMTGFNIALGYSVRYYNDGLLPDEFNWFWGWGTVALLLPYVEFGVTYPLVVGEKGNLLLLDLGFIYIAPKIGISVIY